MTNNLIRGQNQTSGLSCLWVNSNEISQILKISSRQLLLLPLSLLELLLNKLRIRAAGLPLSLLGLLLLLYFLRLSKIKSLETFPAKSTLDDIFIDYFLVLLLVVIIRLEVLEEKLVHFTVRLINHVLLDILEVFSVLLLSIAAVDALKLVKDLVGKTF